LLSSRRVGSISAREAGAVLLMGGLSSSRELRAGLEERGLALVVATTLSQVCELLDSQPWPALAIIDVRDMSPWRAEAMKRVISLVNTAAIPLLCIGELGAEGATRVLPSLSTVATIVGAACELHPEADRFRPCAADPLAAPAAPPATEEHRV
jgi:hypothetical protein